MTLQQKFTYHYPNLKHHIKTKPNDVREPTVIQSSTLPNEYFPKKKTTENILLRNIKLYLIRYCEETTIHGLKYVGERGRCLLERLLWTIIVFVICVLCVLLIRATYIKWKMSPVIVTFAETESSVSKIPFPAVTVCPAVQYDPEIFNFTDMLFRISDGKHLTNKEEEYLQFLPLICESYTLVPIVRWNPTVTPAIRDKLKEIYPKEHLQKADIEWLGNNLTKDVLVMTFTSEGICYTFNMLPFHEIIRYKSGVVNSSSETTQRRKWSIDEGYPPEEDLNVYPRRTSVAGTKGGLYINVLETKESQLDYMCKDALQGFKIALHHPCELPEMERFVWLPLNQALLVGVKPSLITVSHDLLDYSPRDRKCYFSHEKYLSTFRFYTEKNCLFECFVNYTMAQCKCVPFYAPVLHENYAVCGPGMSGCVYQSKIKYMENESDYEFGKQHCGCLPSCTSLSYEIETSQNDWNWKKTFYLDSGNEDIAEDWHLSRLNVYYKDAKFMTCERNELYGTVSLISNIGGLLGLFIGFSLTSVIEIIYFCTLRVICNIKKYGKNSWSGDTELINTT